MKLLQLLRHETSISFRHLVFMIVVASLSSSMVLAIVNTAAQRVSKDQHNTQFLVLFAIAISLYILSQRYILYRSANEVEETIHRIRVRLADKIRRCDLLSLERIGRSALYTAINVDTVTISQTAAILIVAFQSTLLIFFTFLYIAYLSKIAFVLCLTSTSIALLLYFRNVHQVNEQLHEASAYDSEIFDSITHLLDGFKEVRLHTPRSNALFDHTSDISLAATGVKIRVQHQFAQRFILSQISFYLAIGAIVFILPRFSTVYGDVVFKATAAILFIIGPVSNVVNAIPTLASANAAAENIDELETKLEEAHREEEVLTERDTGGFEKIELRGVSFEFVEPSGVRSFTLGPLDLDLESGEMLFVSGGNGSGKSTLLKLLTGLYRPTGGQIFVDGEPVAEADRDAYRNLFSAIFSDYHLFDRLYGLRDVDPEAVEALLREMEIDRKTGLDDGRFRTLDLSSGQKKRLAMVVSRLEDRPIYVFDEWAADQDPEFRERFYRQLLPELQSAGKTIVVVTHDDRYFDLAQRHLRMQDGRFAES